MGETKGEKHQGSECNLMGIRKKVTNLQLSKYTTTLPLNSIIVAAKHPGTKREGFLSKSKKDITFQKRKKKSGKGYLDAAMLDCLAPQVQIYSLIHPFQIKVKSIN